MSATDKLRELLDERGVEWLNDTDPEPQRQTNVWAGEQLVMFHENANGTVGYVVYSTHDLTPEQAIAATVGNDGLERSKNGVGRSNDGADVTCVPDDYTTKLMAEVERLQDENARLRELVEDMYCLAYSSAVEWEVSDAVHDKYSPCEKCHELHGGKSPCAGTSKDMTEECCEPIQAAVVADTMRELGIEVDE